MNIIQLYQDFHITFQTEGHKHCRPGWVNTICPFCIGNPGLHLGAPLSGTHFYCWRCGAHSVPQTLSKLLHISYEQALAIQKQYGGYSGEKPEKPMKTKRFKFPSNVVDLLPSHKKYLSKRGFNPEKIEAEWGVSSLGPICLLDGIYYSHRILAPILWGGNAVSFQARDVTGKSSLKYIACPQARETYHHKHILYGRQDEWTRKGICVEGITDAWRFGIMAFATFGIEFTREQIREMKKHFDFVYVIFDDEPQAVIKAEMLVAELRFRGVGAMRVPIVGDPGGMAQGDADDLVKSLGFPIIF